MFIKPGHHDITPRQREQGARPSSPCALPLLYSYLTLYLCVYSSTLEEYTLDLSLVP